ncbi:uncharacterized protein LOC129754753 [Uranotaenia lowii]|uniref:uncharacterized protein LOC129754753 n=1 Tax=Uranotaenia lowii TaxID=190385 RepID=UPI00247A5BF9|nr:uncharacterized protein LOC129754753 [Uranotaenia lowii]
MSTKIKFSKTSCYYCNEWFESADIEAHITSCGKIVEKCPNHPCKVRVPRKEMDRHLNRCPEGFGEGEPDEPQENGHSKSSSTGKQVEFFPKLPSDKILELEQEIYALRGTLNEEIRQRLALITDLGQMKKRTQLVDEWTKKVGEVLNGLKKCINEETESRCVDISLCKLDISKAVKLFEELNTWRLELTTRFNQVEVDLEKLSEQQKINEASEDSRNQQQSEARTQLVKDAKMVMMESRLNHLQSELENLQLRQQQQHLQRQESTAATTLDSGDYAAVQRKSIDQATLKSLERNRYAIEEIDGKLQTVDMVLEDHHNTIRFFQDEIRRQLFDVQGELDPMRLVVQELLDKQAKLDYELKGVLNGVNESEDSREKIHKTLEKYRRETYYTKQKLDDLQVHLQHQEKLVTIANTEGHLIWRIDQFDKRFRESQENEIMIQSPLFCNKPFGYSLRLEASLNGIGTWRGRNLIVGLIVVNGYYDNLLEWPCTLKGVLTLRDQPQDRSKAVDFSRQILARRKSQHVEKNQYIYIPHQVVLQSEHYLRDDSLFLEVWIEP